MSDADCNTVVITGGTKGLGREISLAFGRAGYFVVAIYHADESAAQALRQDLQAQDSAFLVKRCDLRGDWSLPEIGNPASLTLIHNAAASFVPTPMHLLTWSDFQNQLDVAVRGSFASIQNLIRPLLKARRATVVNVLTQALGEKVPPKGFAAYLAAKHALKGFTQALVSEYGGRGVRAFTVSPGFMQTELTQQWDKRFTDAVLLGGGPKTDPVAAARKILDLVEHASIPGAGEDYAI